LGHAHAHNRGAKMPKSEFMRTSIIVKNFIPQIRKIKLTL